MRLPPWLKTNTFNGLHRTKRLLRAHGLSTVCEEARCPNRGHCFTKPTATFLILGDVCTRGCTFCSVKPGKPVTPDPGEPARVARAAADMCLSYVVVTSVTRDDLPDGGAEQFACTIREIRKHLPSARVEVLTPDFRGNVEAIRTVMEAEPDVFNHNIETVPRLYPDVRPQADYERSLFVLRKAHELSGASLTKSGLMVGLGEREEEVLKVMDDLREANCTMLTIGQYLQPKKTNIRVREYIHPDVFEMYADEARKRGFRFVASAPLARSSMNAEELYEGDSAVAQTRQ